MSTLKSALQSRIESLCLSYRDSITSHDSVAQDVQARAKFESEKNQLLRDTMKMMDNFPHEDRRNSHAREKEDQRLTLLAKSELNHLLGQIAPTLLTPDEFAQMGTLYPQADALARWNC